MSCLPFQGASGPSDFTYTTQVVPPLDELLGDMVTDGRLPSQGVATSIMNQTQQDWYVK